MPLRLRVTSDNRNLFGGEQEKEFAGCGGKLGRGLDNDWIFPDPRHYISGHHALVDFQGGAYYIVDTSRNGVYINDSVAPVGRGKPQRLFDGDVLRVGDYEIDVEITSEDDFAPKEKTKPRKKATSKKIPILDDVEDDDDEPDTMLDSVVRAQLVPEDESMELQLVDEERLIGKDSFDDLLDESSAPYTQLSEEVPSVGAAGRSGRDATKQAEQAAMATLLKSAGLKPTDFAGVEPAEILHVAGQVLRKMVEGLTALMQERAELKTTFRLTETTVLAGSNNPLKFSSSPGDALKYLLGNGNEEYLPAVEAVRTSFQAVNDHEQAIPRALVQAFREFMDRFAPDELSQQFDHYLKRNRLLSVTNKRKYWELYEETFSELTRSDKGALPEAFNQEFAKAYKEEVDALKSSRGNK
jgi:type VI secretion system FHA domain protein